MTTRIVRSAWIEALRAAGVRVDVLIDFGGDRYLVTTHQSLRSSDLALDAESTLASFRGSGRGVLPDGLNGFGWPKPAG